MAMLCDVCGEDVLGHKAGGLDECMARREEAAATLEVFREAAETDLMKRTLADVSMPDTRPECEATLHFDLMAMTRRDRERVYKAAELLKLAGISFDTGVGGGVMDWSLDWSLSGPVRLVFKKFKGPSA